MCSKQIWEIINSELEKEKMMEIDLVGRVRYIPKDYDSYLLRTPNQQKIVLEIESILNTKTKKSNSKIYVTPWTLFKTSYNDAPYGFTYLHHNLYDDDIEKSINWMKKYVKERNGKSIITDFDEETNSLNAEFPLSSCINNGINHSDIIEFCQKIGSQF